MTKKILYYYKRFLIGLFLVFLFVGAVGLANSVVINIYESNVEVAELIEEESDTIGGGGPSLRVPWDFKEGIKVDDTFIVDGDRLGYYNIAVDGVFDNTATTSGETTDEWSTTTFAYWTNPNSDKDVIIEDLYLDNTEAFSAYASGFKCGTTTSKGSMDIYPFNQWTSSSTDTSAALTLIASTSLPTTFNALVDGFIGVENYPGTAFETYDRETTKATSTKFVLGGGESVVCTYNLNKMATSTRSTNPDVAGFTGAVVMKAKAYLRGE